MVTRKTKEGKSTFPVLHKPDRPDRPDRPKKPYNLEFGILNFESGMLNLAQPATLPTLFG